LKDSLALSNRAPSRHYPKLTKVQDLVSLIARINCYSLPKPNAAASFTSTEIPGPMVEDNVIERRY
jgi:hypothetical protein